MSRAHLHQVRELGRGAKQLREAHGLPDRVADLHRHIFLDIARSPVLGALLSLSFAFFAHLRLGFAVLVDGHGRRLDWKNNGVLKKKNLRKASFRAIRSERGVEMDTIVLSTKRLFKAEIPPFADCLKASPP